MGMDLGAKAGSVKSDINVTPLVDVVLVLLIIFMVVTPMLQKGQAVKLPIAGNPEKKDDDDKTTLMVVLTNKPNDPNRFWIGKERFTEAAFKEKIVEEFTRSPGKNVLFKADAGLTYGEVKKVLMKIKDAGFKSVALVATKKGQGGGS